MNLNGSEHDKLNPKLLSLKEIKEHLEDVYRQPIDDPNDDKEEVVKFLEGNSSSSYIVEDSEGRVVLNAGEERYESAAEDLRGREEEEEGDDNDNDFHGDADENHDEGVFDSSNDKYVFENYSLNLFKHPDPSRRIEQILWSLQKTFLARD